MKNHDKDILETHLLDCNDVFCDVCRAFIPGMEDAQENEFEAFFVRSFQQKDERLMQLERDVVKLWKPDGIPQAVIGIENQTAYDPCISHRVLQYNVGSIERMRSMKMKPVKVTTIVLYFGIKRPWKQARSIYEIVQGQEDWKEYFPDFRVTVIDLGALPDQTIQQLRSDLGPIARYIKYLRAGNPLNIQNKYLDKTPIRHYELVDAVLYILWRTMTENSEEIEFIRPQKVIIPQMENRTMENLVNNIYAEEHRQYGQQVYQKGIQKGKQEYKQEYIKLSTYLQQIGHIDWITTFLSCPLSAGESLKRLKRIYGE